MDYRDLIAVRTWPSFAAYCETMAPKKIWAVTKFAKLRYDRGRFQLGDALLFGAEQTGLPEAIHTQFDSTAKIYIPMQQGVRSLNLSNAVALVAYEAWRQCDFVSPA